MDELLTIREIAIETGISESTIRRYIGDYYREFFVSTEFNHVKKYSSEAVTICKLIKELSSQGKGVAEIRENLRGEYVQTIESESEHETKANALALTNKELLGYMELIVLSLNELKESNRNTSQFINHIIKLEEKITSLEAQMQQSNSETKVGWLKKMWNNWKK